MEHHEGFVVGECGRDEAVSTPCGEDDRAYNSTPTYTIGHGHHDGRARTTRAAAPDRSAPAYSHPRGHSSLTRMCSLGWMWWVINNPRSIRFRDVDKC